MMVRPFLLSLLFYLFIISTHSQQYYFSNYSIEQGLSQSVVNSVIQDSKGFIWMGTQNGLNKFNGYSFEVYSYKPTDPYSLSNNWIYSMTEDSEGNFWIGTKSGLNKFNSAKNRFERIRYHSGYPNDVGEYIYDVAVSRTGLILVNTPPVLTIFNPGKNEFNHYINNLPFDEAVKDNRIPLLEDSEGKIWVGSTRGLACFDMKTKTFTNFLNDNHSTGSISENNITALFEDKTGNIWIGTSNGLNRLEKKTKRITRFFHDSKNEFSISSNFIRAITADKSGNLWIGTEGQGLNKLTFTGKEMPVFEQFSSESNLINSNIILALCIDKSENLWLGTLQGVSKTDLKKRKFRVYRKSSSPYSVDLLGNVIGSIFKDENDILWIGNWGQGLNLYNRKTGHVEHFSSHLTQNHHLSNDYIHVIFQDSEKRIWLGTRDGVFIYQKENHAFIRFNTFFSGKDLPGFNGIRIYSIIQDKSNKYWIGTQAGLFRINLTDFSVEHFNKEAKENHRISSNLIYSLLEDREGLIWIGTLDGLDVYYPKTGKIVHHKKSRISTNSLCDNFVISLCEDNKGNIWIGTSSYVNKFVKKDSVFIYFSQENGLPNNRIFDILKDDLNTLWFATGNGLCRLDTATSRFRTYTVEEGLQSPEFNLKASYKSSDGELFFGGMNGFNSFFPGNLQDNPYKPEIVFTSFVMNQNGKESTVDIVDGSEIELESDVYSFTVAFAALEFTNPEKNRYRYRMSGIADEWINLDNRRFVTFSNLPPGKYLLQVKCSNNDGKWNEESSSLKIEILPPWWKTGIACLIYAVLIILIIILIILQRERKVKKVRTVLEERVNQRTIQIENQKTEILAKNEELRQLNVTKDKFFSILAHDLRNPFNSILGITDLLLSDYDQYDKQKAKHYLSSIRDASQHAYDLLQNLLIWARSQTGNLEFRPVDFEVGSMIRDNIDLVKTQARKKNIRLTSNVEDDQRVTGDINMINTVLRNLLTNAIKFTPLNGRIDISIAEKNGSYEIHIKDSGVGIKPENISKIFKIDSKFSTKGTDQEKGTGLGLILCKEFLEIHGGEIRVESTPGKGSTFIIVLPK